MWSISPSTSMAVTLGLKGIEVIWTPSLFEFGVAAIVVTFFMMSWVRLMSLWCGARRKRHNVAIEKVPQADPVPPPVPTMLTSVTSRSPVFWVAQGKVWHTSRLCTALHANTDIIETPSHVLSLPPCKKCARLFLAAACSTARR